MELNLNNSSISTEKNIYEGTLEQGVDYEINLPEYCNDILRILKCQITPGITSTNLVGDRVTIDGQTTIRLFYSDEGCKTVRCYEQIVPFSKAVDLSNNDCIAPQISVTCKVEYCNCRAINQRRVDVHGAFSMGVRVCCQTPKNVLENCKGGGVQTKCSNKKVLGRIGGSTRLFPLNEVFEIGQSKPTIKNIVNCYYSCVVTEYKVITNKILVKGELKIKVLYCADNKEEEMCNIESVIPTSQIIDIDGIDEGQITNVVMRAEAVNVIAKADMNNELRLMEVSGKLCVEVTAYENREIKVINDAYSINNNLICDKSSITMNTLLGTVSENVQSKHIINFGQSEIKQVFDLFISSVNSNFKIVSECIVIFGTLTVNILYADSDEKVSFIERAIDFEYNTKIMTKETAVSGSHTVIPVNLDYSIQDSSRIEVRIEQKIEALIIGSENQTVISDIKIDQDNPKNDSSPTLTIYFAVENETVWEIARKFNTTEEAIYAENELNGEVITRPLMLLIPGV